jgi:predicted peroxiredoxin
MARRIVSVLRSAPPALRGTDPALEANAYAVAEDLDLTLVLREAAVELAVRAAEVRPADVAGVALPPAAGGQDLRGLVESGVRVVADAESLGAHGLRRNDLVPGVEIADQATIFSLLEASDGVLTW